MRTSAKMTPNQIAEAAKNDFNARYPIGTLATWTDRYGETTEVRTISPAYAHDGVAQVCCACMIGGIPLDQLAVIDEVSDVPGLDDDCGLFTPPRNGDAA